MSIVRTDLGDTRERARELRFEATPLIQKNNVQTAIEAVSIAAAGPFPVIPTNIGFADSPYTVLQADTMIYVDTSGGAVTINLQPAADRGGISLGIKDVTGNAATNNISVVPDGAETIDTLDPYPIFGDFGGIQLNPIPGTGYTVAP